MLLKTKFIPQEALWVSPSYQNTDKSLLLVALLQICDSKATCRLPVAEPEDQIPCKHFWLIWQISDVSGSRWGFCSVVFPLHC